MLEDIPCLSIILTVAPPLCSLESLLMYFSFVRSKNTPLSHGIKLESIRWQSFRFIIIVFVVIFNTHTLIFFRYGTLAYLTFYVAPPRCGFPSQCLKWTEYIPFAFRNCWLSLYRLGTSEILLSFFVNSEPRNCTSSR